MGKRLKTAIEYFEEIVVSIIFVNMCLFVVIQIISRYLFRSPLIYTEEMARFSYVWVTFFGMAIATKRENHIRIDILSMIVRGKGEAFINLLVNLVSLVLYVALVIIGIRYTSMTAIRVSPAMEISMAIVFVSLPLGAFFSVLRLAGIIWRDINSLRSE